jgi:hypothetical protein
VGYQLYLDQKYHPALVALEARQMLAPRDWAHLERFALEVLRLAAVDVESAQVLADSLVALMTAAQTRFPSAVIRTAPAAKPPGSDS